MRAIVVISFCAFMMQVAGAQTPAPFPEFTFKRVTPPTGSGPRINVQIAPFVVPGLPEITAAAPVEPGVGDPDVDAFWDALGTDIAWQAPLDLNVRAQIFAILVLRRLPYN